MVGGPQEDGVGERRERERGREAPKSAYIGGSDLLAAQGLVEARKVELHVQRELVRLAQHLHV